MRNITEITNEMIDEIGEMDRVSPIILPPGKSLASEVESVCDQIQAIESNLKRLRSRLILVREKLNQKEGI